MPPFVPPDFIVPSGFETESMRARMLTIHDVLRDFEAVTSSASYLKPMFPIWRGWPEGLTLEQNLIDLGWHQKEFQLRKAFAYTLVTLDEAKTLGCVYVEPTRRRDFDAEIFFWAREAEIDAEADRELAAIIAPWIDRDWPFSKVLYPGRSMSWEDWAKLPLRGNTM